MLAMQLDDDIYNHIVLYIYIYRERERDLCFGYFHLFCFFLACDDKFGFFSSWHINLLGLFNAIFVEE